MKKRYVGIVITAAFIILQSVNVYAEKSVNTAPQFVTGGELNATKTSTVGEEISAIIIGDTRLSILKGFAATAGLPEATVNAINAINAAQTPLSEIIKDVDLNGYLALTAIDVLVVKDAANQAVKTGTVTVPLYVPNLVEGVGTIQVLFYNNATGRWEIITPKSIDYANKQIIVDINGSGSYSIIYKK